MIQNISLYYFSFKIIIIFFKWLKKRYFYFFLQFCFSNAVAWIIIILFCFDYCILSTKNICGSHTSRKWTGRIKQSNPMGSRLNENNPTSPPFFSNNHDDPWSPQWSGLIYIYLKKHLKEIQIKIFTFKWCHECYKKLALFRD